MSTPVVLAEKPSQANAYASAFSTTKGEGYISINKCSIFPKGAKITWGVGHLVELKSPEQYKEEWKTWSLATLPIIPNEFELQPSSRTKDQFKIVKRLLNEANEIIIATDCDREGENIARSIIEVSGNAHKPMKRLWINSLEVEEVKKGFSNLQAAAPYYPMYREAQARQISDWIVGISGTRLYSVLLQQQGLQTKGAWSVGRVQTPTLKLIYDRQQAIQHFKSEPFYELTGDFQTNQGAYKGKYKGRYKDKAELEKLMQQQGIHGEEQGTVTEIKKEEKRTKPPKLHSLSSLQTLANKKYKYSPSETLKIVQSLYDNPLKLVSYPRTDTQHITENEFKYLRENLTSYQNLAAQTFEPSFLEPQKRYVDNQKVQEHYAIIPTKKIPDSSTLNKLDQKQTNLYFEVVKSALAMFHHDYVYEETQVITEVKELPFKSTGKIEKLRGWKSLFASDKSDNEDQEENQDLPPVEKGLNVDAQVLIKEGKTQPPKPYTEGQLITMMKTCGKQVDDEEAQETLKDVEGLGTEATRSSIIETLIKQQYIEVKKNKVTVTEKGEILCKAVEGTLLSKPDMTAKWEQFLKRIGANEAKQEDFIANTKKFVSKLVEQAQEDIKNVDTTKAQKAMQDEQHIALCPSCQNGHIVDRKKFYGCSAYSEGCKQTFPKAFLGKNLTKTQVKNLCEKDKTNLIKGFKSKKGKTFDAFLLRTQDGIRLEFPSKAEKT